MRAWKDEEFRNSLSNKERSLLPEHPSGLVELTDRELGAAAGGVRDTLSQCETVRRFCK
ncbi:mersacidin/lichenicidin family type 2 lantibiotic [Aetokthonos hydrillicola]|uniref:mersacidin/lichenicidin family type 2 lantibiotic n=1 Tax=Aetokthonos hydrillicola TaxID=1550245 RepID=UPI0030DB77EC